MCAWEVMYSTRISIEKVQCRFYENHPFLSITVKVIKFYPAIAFKYKLFQVYIIVFNCIINLCLVINLKKNRKQR